MRKCSSSISNIILCVVSGTTRSDHISLPFPRSEDSEMRKLFFNKYLVLLNYKKLTLVKPKCKKLSFLEHNYKKLSSTRLSCKKLNYYGLKCRMLAFMELNYRMLFWEGPSCRMLAYIALN